MITIVKGNSKLVVSKGTYEEQFKHLGYQIASKGKGATKQVASLFEKEEKEDNQEEEEEKELSEKFGLKEEEKTSTSRKGK